MKVLYFKFVTVVWGDSYTKMFLSVVLPSLLSQGNLTGFPYKDGSKYLIYTRSQDAHTIKASAVYAKLSQVISTEIILTDDLDFHGNKYGIDIECRRRALATQDDDNCCFVFPCPDVVLADGTFSNMAKIAATGKRAILSTGLSAVTETCLPHLLGRFYSAQTCSITISPRESVRLALEHLYPPVSTLFWDSPQFVAGPFDYYWNVPGEGVLSRWFHPTPLMVRPQRKITSFTGSMDSGDYLKRACPDPKDLYVVGDSDEIFCLGLGNLPRKTLSAPNKSSALKVARLAAGTTNRYDRWFFKHKVRIHYTDVSERWEQVERESDMAVDTILLLLKFRIIFFLIDWETSLRRLRRDLTHSRLGRVAVKALKRKRAVW